MEMLRVDKLTNSFGKSVVHKDLSLTLDKGEILGLVGGSGAGKSVLLHSILGLRRTQGGHIRIMGVDVENANALKKMRPHLGVLFQSGALFSSLSVLENVKVPMRESTRMNDALMNSIALMKLSLVGLPESAADKLPAELSGGMKKRAGLARALALDPAILFLDEPTAGLDPVGAAAFDDLVRDLHAALGLTVFMITHDQDTLHAICTRVAVLAEKRILATGSIDEIRAVDHPWIQEYFSGPRCRAASLAWAEGAPPPQTPPQGA